MKVSCRMLRTPSKLGIVNVAERDNREHDCQVRKWEAQMKAAGWWDQAAPPPAEGPATDSGFRALPMVHDALHRDDPKAPATQGSLPKKAPPTTGKGMPSGFYRAEAPPMIGTSKAPSPPQPYLPPATTTTPAHPPRPSSAALPKPVQEPSPPATLKHPLPQPAQQGPPNKQGRSKELPRGPDGNPILPMSAPPAVDLAKVGAPTPKDPPVSLMPTPPQVQAAQPTESCAAAALPSQDV